MLPKHPEGNVLMWPRQLVGLWIVHLGKRIEDLGDWIGGWDGSKGYALGFKMGVRMEREAAKDRTWKRQRSRLGDEW